MTDTTTSRGRAAEALAAEHLRTEGMTILAQNVRVSRLELDIIAADGRTVVVVEVKARGRGSWAKAHQSVDWRKRERTRRAAAILWARRFSRDRRFDRLRFDVVAVDLHTGLATRFAAAFC
ncbi:MAG: YraN family protein [Myxococcota bacterium]